MMVRSGWRYHDDDWPERSPSAPYAIAIAIAWALAALVLLVVLALRFI
jgi:hypothetical protein